MTRRFLVASAAAALLAAAPAAAQGRGGPAHATLDNQLSGFLGLAYWYGAGAGLGIGGRFQRTLVPGGILRDAGAAVPDDIGLELGADWFHYDWRQAGLRWSYDELAPVVGAVWNFWITPQLAVYPKLDVGYRLGWWSSNDGVTRPSGYGGLFVQGALGAAFRLPNLTLRAEAGSGMLKLGLGLEL
jgi:hypothetical protein